MNVRLNEQVILTGLLQLFAPDKWFDICRVQALCLLAGAHLTPAQNALFGVVHCVHYNTMLPGMRESLAAEVVQVLQQQMPDLQFSVTEPVRRTVEVTAPAQEPAPRGMLRRLLGGAS